jgi:hypothetical protein
MHVNFEAIGAKRAASSFDTQAYQRTGGRIIVRVRGEEENAAVVLT